MAAIVNFHRITPSPDAKLKTTPLPRSSHGISILNGGKRLVLYGGENVARTPIADARQALWLAEKTKSDVGGGVEWNWISPIADVDGGGATAASPNSRVAHSQATVGDDSVYVFGGRAGVTMGESPFNDLWKLDIIGGNEQECRVAKWTEIAPAPGSEVPEARSFHKMISISTDLYVFGGCGAKGRLNDLWKFDTVGKEWTNLGCSHVLKGRGGPNILALSKDSTEEVKIAIVAGFAGEETNDGHVFNTNSWETKGMDGLAEMRKRSVCAFGSLPKHNKCILFGGEVDPSCKGHEGAGNFERDVVLLDGTNGSLLEVIKPEQEVDWPKARGWADAAVGEDDTFFLFGGLAGDDTTPVRLDDLWECHISG